MSAMTFGLLKVAVKHTFTRNGVFYFQRAIPKDIRGHYGSALVKLNLKTSDPFEAASKVSILITRLDQDWDAIRSGHPHSPAAIQELSRCLRSSSRGADLIKVVDTVGIPYPEAESASPMNASSSEANQQPPNAVLLSCLGDIYLSNHKKGYASRRLVVDTNRVVKLLIKQCSDIPITQFSRQEANRFRDYLLTQTVKTATVRRRVGTAAAMFSTAIRELELDKTNPFQSIQIMGEGRDADSREVFTPDDLQKVQKAAMERDDDVRWLVAMHSDLGCRISDVAGLSLKDIVLDAPIPYVFFREDLSRNRTLKTGGIGERKVPLVGASLWAAGRVLKEAKPGQVFAFPRYCTATKVNGDSASATVNKWLRGLGLNKTYTSHSFRHSMADRLREVGCPEDIRKAIGGWSSDDIAGKYGEGYSLKVMKGWLDKVVLKKY